MLFFYFYLLKRTYCAPDHLVFSFEGLCVYVILAPEAARVGQGAIHEHGPIWRSHTST